MAEAEAIKARADALAENQDAVIGQQLAEKWPAIVEAAAKPFGDIDQMIVLNGAQGLSDALAQALSQGVAGLQMARSLLAGGNGSNADGSADGDSPNGQAPADAPKAVADGTTDRLTVRPHLPATLEVSTPRKRARRPRVFGGQTWSAWSFQCSSRRTRLRSLPLSVRGSWSRTS